MKCLGFLCKTNYMKMLLFNFKFKPTLSMLFLDVSQQTLNQERACGEPLNKYSINANPHYVCNVTKNKQTFLSWCWCFYARKKMCEIGWISGVFVGREKWQFWHLLGEISPWQSNIIKALEIWLGHLFTKHCCCCCCFVCLFSVGMPQHSNKICH